MTDSFEVPTIRRLLVTRQFALSYDRMTPFAARQLDRALKRLLASPGGPAVRLCPLVFPAGYHVLRFGHRDRALLRFDGEAALLLDAASFAEIARLNARAAHRLRTWRWY